MNQNFTLPFAPLRRRKNYFRVFFLLLAFAVISPVAANTAGAASARTARTIEDQQRDVLRFGTEAEIATLIQVLRSENITYLDADLIEIAERTRNRHILSGIFTFFGEREESGLESRAIRAITGRDYEVNETVLAAVDYLGRVQAAQAADALKELIHSRESRFLNNAIRALGRVSRGEEILELTVAVETTEVTVLVEVTELAESVEEPEVIELVEVAEPTELVELAETAEPTELAELTEPTVLAELMDTEPAEFAELAEGTEMEEPEFSEPLALPDRIALFLLDHYQNRNPGDETMRELIVAMGETESSKVVPFLSELIMDGDERAVLRMAALDAMSRIGDEEGLDAVIEAVSATDPNVRSSAIAALGPFSGEVVDNAILDGFRDSFFRTRIGAASAAGERQLESAIPFLRFRAHNDDVPVVRDEAIRALGAINNDETMEILDSLFTERRNSDRTRLVAAEMLLRNDPDTYVPKIGREMDYARSRNQTPLLNGFIRILAPVKSPSLEDLARRLIANGGVIERSLALQVILNNEFRGLEEDVRTLLDVRRNGASIAQRARSTLERLGFEVDVESET